MAAEEERFTEDESLRAMKPRAELDSTGDGVKRSCSIRRCGKGAVKPRAEHCTRRSESKVEIVKTVLASNEAKGRARYTAV